MSCSSETAPPPQEAAPEESAAVPSEQVPTAPLADAESSGEETTTSDAAATDEPAPPSDTGADDEEATEAAAAAAAAVADDGPSTSDRADRVSTDNPILREIAKHSNQLYRLIVVCKRKISYNIQARDTILGLDAILAARSPTTSPSSFVNAMIDIYKSLVTHLPRAFELQDIETIRHNVFTFYNLEHVLATRCCRRSQRLASKRRQQRGRQQYFN